MKDIRVNASFEGLSGKYLFAEVADRVRAYKASHPGTEIIRMDIGDVTRPLFGCVRDAMERAVREQATASGFHGYGPEQGYDWLRQVIADIDYRSRGIDMDAADIFVSDGAKSDLGNLGELLPADAVVAVTDPGYPVYADSAIMDGHRVLPLECNAETQFLPRIPDAHADAVILCSPHNPTGVCMTVAQLQEWVDWARREGVLLIFDSAYEAYVRHEGLARSVYECQGARECAIEVRSYSKSAGFTGVRCGYTVVPRQLEGRYADGGLASLNALWNRRQTTKFNGVAYVVQRGAQSLYTPAGMRDIREATDYYTANARMIADTLRTRGFEVWGGDNSPYVWARREGDSDSWQLFDSILDRCGVSVTPGVGFGSGGEGYIRLTGFNTRAATTQAINRLAAL